MKITRTIELPSRPPTANVGRNDPCPCGSGKKYKKCHLMRDQAAASSSVPTTTIVKPGWIARVTDWAAAQPWYEALLKQAVMEVFGRRRRVTEDEIQALAETVLFEFPTPSAKTPLQQFIEDAPISSQQRVVYQDWLDRGMFGSWEVTDVVLGRQVTVCQTGTKKTFAVVEHLGSYNLSPGDVIMARLLPMGDEWMFGGGLSAKLPEPMGYWLKRHHADRISERAFIKTWFRPISDRKPERIKENGRQLRQELFTIVKTFELPFDLTDFDRRLREATNPHAFFSALYVSAHGREKLLQRLMTLCSAIWTERRGGGDDPMRKESGPLETTLVQEFFRECVRYLERAELVHPEEQQRASQQRWQEWIDKPQKELDGRTPRQTIMAERAKLDNHDEDLNWEFSAVIYPKRWSDAWDLHRRGVRAHLRGNWRISNRIFQDVLKRFPYFPDRYRTLANLAVGRAALGDKKRAITLLQQSLSVNPNYRFARQWLKKLNRELMNGKSEAETCHSLGLTFVPSKKRDSTATLTA